MKGIVMSLDGLDLRRRSVPKNDCRCRRTKRGYRSFCLRDDGRVEIHGTCKPKKRR